MLGLGLAALGGPEYLRTALAGRQFSERKQQQQYKQEQLRKFGQRLFKMGDLSQENILKAAEGLDIHPMEILDAVKGFALLKQKQEKELSPLDQIKYDMEQLKYKVASIFLKNNLLLLCFLQ